MENKDGCSKGLPVIFVVGRDGFDDRTIHERATSAAVEALEKKFDRAPTGYLIILLLYIVEPWALFVYSIYDRIYVNK